MSLNLAQIAPQVKRMAETLAAQPDPEVVHYEYEPFELTDARKRDRARNIARTNPAMGPYYRALTEAGWQFADTVHPVDRVSVYERNGAQIRRDPDNNPGCWIVDWDGHTWFMCGTPAKVTAVVDRLMAECAPAPAPLSAAAQIAADLTAEYPALTSRIAKALELVEAGATEFPQYSTRHFISNGNSIMRECDCPDATHRPHITAFGAGCKHALAQEIKYRLDRESTAVKVRKLTDIIERDRARLQATAGAYAAALRPDPLNAMKDNRRIFHGGRR